MFICVLLLLSSLSVKDCHYTTHHHVMLFAQFYISVDKILFCYYHYCGVLIHLFRIYQFVS